MEKHRQVVFEVPFNETIKWGVWKSPVRWFSKSRSMKLSSGEYGT